MNQLMPENKALCPVETAFYLSIQAAIYRLGEGVIQLPSGHCDDMKVAYFTTDAPES